jgi:peptide/nickel transport system substrate-binding protein
MPSVSLRGLTRSFGLWSLAVAGLLACTPVGPRAPAGSADEAGRGASGAPKTISLGVLRPIEAFGPWDPSGAGGTFALHNIHSNSLITTDATGNYEGRLLASVPTFDDSSIVVTPDGRMRTTWKLRPNIKWHDGAPFTAEDLVFSLRVNTHPDVPLRSSIQIQQMERIEVVDSLTATVTWKTTFYQPNYLGLREFWPFPHHLLAEAFEGDKQAFVNLAYWTTDFVSTGPFRLADYGMGQNLVYQRFEDYFLGRPKVNTIIVQVFGEPNSLFASLLSRTLDIAADNALPWDLYVQLREDWGRSGSGTVIQRQGNWRFLAVQFHPEWGRSPELGRDVRIRRGLYAALDRDALREAVLPGFSDLTGADSFMDRADAKAPVVGQPFARYRFDTARALQDLADAGWRRGADGRMVNAAGEQIELAVRSAPGEEKEIAIAAQYWRDLGMAVTEEIPPLSLLRDREFVAKFPGFEASARGSGDFMLAHFDSRQAPTSQNRFVGANAGSYANPALDRLIDRLYSTIPEPEQALLLKEIGELMAADLPALPIYFQVKMAAAGKGVRALVDDFGGTGGPGFLSRGAHLWDRD